MGTDMDTGIRTTMITRTIMVTSKTTGMMTARNQAPMTMASGPEITSF